MIYDFDYFSRYECPTLVLCQPDDSEIGVIQEYSDLKLVVNLNEFSTLSYKIYNSDELLEIDGEIGGVTKEWIPDPSQPNIYRLHKERREVHALGLGYFVITDITECEDDSGVYKNVTCKSCEYELNNIACPGVALREVNMYPLYNNESYDALSNYEKFKYLADVTTADVGDDDTGVYVSESCILFELLRYAPTWRLSDECIARFNGNDSRYTEMASAMRNLTDEDTTIYSYLKKNVSDAWDCFISFNIEDRTIDIYRYEDVLVPSDIILSEANILDKCEVKSDIDDYVNSLRVAGGTDDLYISDFTPTGENVIYNFDHDIATGIISGELKEGLEHWASVSSLGSLVTIPEGSNIPKEVYPDRLSGYNGNDLYEFLYGTEKALTAWSKKYDEAKGAGSAAMANLVPPEIAVHAGGGGQDKYGVYKFTLKHALRTPTNEGGGDVLHITCGQLDVAYNNNPSSPASTIAAQISAIVALLSNSQSGFTNIFTLSSDEDSITFTQIQAGNGVPGFYIVNNDFNIEGIGAMTIETFGYVAAKTSYLAYYVNDSAAGDLSRTDALEWVEEFYATSSGEDIDISEANKVLQYLEEELILADDCFVFAENYMNAYDAQLKALEKSKDAETISEGDYQEWTNEYNVVKAYYDLAASLYEAYGTIKNQISAGVTRLREILDSNAYVHTFQGAFFDFYKDKGLSDADAQTKAMSLYSRLTRVIKQQKYQDNALVITDAMTMMEKYAQEEDLYNRSMNILARLIQPNAEISVDAEAFMFNEEYGEITSNIKMGYCIYVQLPNGEVPLYHLNQITIDYDAPSCQVVFGDRIRSSDPADIFGELQSAATTAANIVASERIDWGIKNASVNYLMKEKDADIASTFRAMNNSVNNVTIDSLGLSCYSVDPETNQEQYGFWGANGSMMFYEYRDGQRVPRVAIGRMFKANGEIEYGFWGDTIIANTITADKLAVGAITNGSNYIRNGSLEGCYGVGRNAKSVQDWKQGDGSTNILCNAESGSYPYRIVSASTSSQDPISYVPVGDECIKISKVSGDSNQSTMVQTTDPLSAGTYTLSYYYLLHSNGTDNASLQVKAAITPSTATNVHIYDHPSDSEEEYNKWHKAVHEIEIGTDGQVVTLSFESTNDDVYIDAVMLAKGNNSEYSPHVSEVAAKYTSINQDGVSIYDGKFVIYDAAGVPRIYTDNNGFNVRGQIIADRLVANTEGELAGWVIDAHTIKKDAGNSHYPVGISSSNAYPSIWAGRTDAGMPNLFTADNSGTYYYNEQTGDYDTPIPMGYTGQHFKKIDNVLSNLAKFVLLDDGTLYASDAHIRGEVTATSLSLYEGEHFKPVATQAYADGSASSALQDANRYTDTKLDNLDVDIGGWQVTSTYGDGLMGTNYNEYKIYLTSTPEDKDSWVIWTGNQIPSKNLTSTAFGVTADGRLYCHGAQVNGDIICNSLSAGSITVTSGSSNAKLGNSWTIGDNTLYTTSGGADSSTYTLDNNGTFMLDSTGNAYSYGAFYTRSAGYLGIKITNYDIVFTKSRDDSVQAEGAISFTGEGSGELAMSAKTLISFGKRNSNNNIDGKVSLDVNSSVFGPSIVGSGTLVSVGLGNNKRRWYDLYVQDAIHLGSVDSVGYIHVLSGKPHWHGSDGVEYPMYFG